MGSNDESSVGRGKTTQKTTGRGGNNFPKNMTPLSQEKAGRVPRFLVIKRIDEGNFDKVSPFVISKCLFGLFGNLKDIKKVKDGLLVETVSEPQAKKVLKTERVCNHNVTVEPHKSLNNSKGVVVCSDLLNCSEEEILNEMSTEGVIAVKRIKRRINGTLVDTSNHIFTFDRPILPNKVKIAFYSLEVRPYIPNPLRCFNCQKFGHITDSCKDEKICACGNPPHVGQVCRDPIKCVNCEGPHSAKSRTCPKMVEENNIQKVKVLEKLSYAEAKRKVCGPKKTNLTTYAQVANTNNISDTILQIIPSITNIIESKIKSIFNEHTNRTSSSSQQIATSFSQRSENMEPPRYTTKGTQLRKSNSVPDASQATTSEKRKSAQLEDSVDSDDSLLSSQASDTSRTTKKKRGWPKGKSRKTPEEQSLSQTSGQQSLSQALEHHSLSQAQNETNL